jgi:hypothetical protein
LIDEEVQNGLNVDDEEKNVTTIGFILLEGRELRNITGRKVVVSDGTVAP